MPRASVNSTTNVNPGDLRSPRAANRMSRQKPCIGDGPLREPLSATMAFVPHMTCEAAIRLGAAGSNRCTRILRRQARQVPDREAASKEADENGAKQLSIPNSQFPNG